MVRMRCESLDVMRTRTRSTNIRTQIIAICLRLVMAVGLDMNELLLNISLVYAAQVCIHKMNESSSKLLMPLRYTLQVAQRTGKRGIAASDEKNN